MANMRAVVRSRTTALDCVWVPLCSPVTGKTFSHTMPSVVTPGRRWVTALLERPFGRGVNLQITVDDVTPILASLNVVGWPLFLALEEVWYRAGTSETGVRQFLVQDPDG